MVASTDASFRESPGLSKPGSYIPALTGLRAVAAYLVFLHHYNPGPSGSFAHRLFAQGYIGVSVFFVLSGFLIYHRYADVYFGQQDWSWRRYGQNRFARIFPLYALLLGITVGVDAVVGRPMSLSLVGLNFTLLKGFFEKYKFSGIAQSWSLTVEACFYLSAPLLFRALQRWSVGQLTAGLLGIGLFGWAMVGQVAGHGEFTRGLFEGLPFVLFYTFFGRAFEFVVGMWLARRWHPKSVLTFRCPPFGGVLILSACVLWQASITMFTTNPIALIWSEVVVYNYALPIGIGLVFIRLPDDKSMSRRVLSQPVLRALGQSSYVFYLIHMGVVASGLRKVGVVSHWLLFGLLVLIAHGLYLFVEKPLHRYLRAFRLVNK